MSDSSAERIVVTIDPDLEEILPVFFSVRRKDIEAIAELLEQGDFARIRIIGHNIKGAGGGFGFDAISEMGQRIESAAERGAAADILACIAELADYLQRVEVRFG
jgi:HPt (histidine-containing phosphotransfer) domain-containing protein